VTFFTPACPTAESAKVLSNCTLPVQAGRSICFVLAGMETKFAFGVSDTVYSIPAVKPDTSTEPWALSFGPIVIDGDATVFPSLSLTVKPNVNEGSPAWRIDGIVFLMVKVTSGFVVISV